MTVRTLNRLVTAGLGVLVLAFLAGAIAGLFERPFRLSASLAHLAPLAILLVVFPQGLKTMRQRAQTYGLDGKLPERQTRIMTTVMLLGLVALIAGAALGFYAGYSGAGRHA